MALIKRRDAARMLGIHECTLDQWVSRPEYDLHPVRLLSNRVMFKSEEIERLAGGSISSAQFADQFIEDLKRKAGQPDTNTQTAAEMETELKALIARVKEQVEQAEDRFIALPRDEEARRSAIEDNTNKFRRIVQAILVA